MPYRLFPESIESQFRPTQTQCAADFGDAARFFEGAERVRGDLDHVLREVGEGVVRYQPKLTPFKTCYWTCVRCFCPSVSNMPGEQSAATIWRLGKRAQGVVVITPFPAPLSKAFAKVSDRDSSLT